MCRNSLGEIPVIRLKYFPKNDWEGNPSDSLISRIGRFVERSCASLEELQFTPTFTAIPDELCKGCSRLKAIDLPSTIASVGAFAFAGCTGVESITCFTATPPVCSASTFEGIDPSIPVTVSAASVGQYATAPGWSRFLHISGKY